MKRLAIVFLFLVSIPSLAKHIVGGEIEMLYLGDSRYRINLIFYFDALNNPTVNPAFEAPYLTIFRKADNVMMMDSIRLSWVSTSRVAYTQAACFQGELINDKIIYTNTVYLQPALYGDLNGYYIMWARCCRNYTISNIESHDPTAGIAAGQTFYLEFPPVIKNGQAFINSSPHNFPALKDYACIKKPYYVNFAGVDDDGDSLVYSLVTPLSTVTNEPVPPATPAPYPDVQWINGYGVDRIVNGSPKDPMYPDMSITTAGFLRVTPRSQGLYVFAVKIEEYRNNTKIGEARRDFQLLVIDCTPSAPPVITGRASYGTTLLSDNLSIHYNNTVVDSSRYVLVNITDPDALNPQDNMEEVITIGVVPLNFKATDLSYLIPNPDVEIIHGAGSVQFKIPIPKCPFGSGPYKIGIIAYDDACALPQSDTLDVDVDVQPPDNQRVVFNPPKLITATLMEGDQESWPFEAHDPDGDSLSFFTSPRGFDMGISGMTATVDSNENGVLKGTFHWDAFCDIYDFTKRTSFILDLIVDDKDVCDVNPPDLMTFDLAVILPLVASPVVDTDLTADPAEVVVDGIEKKIFDSWTFTVTGKDPDNTIVRLEIEGDDYAPSDYGMTFVEASAVGNISSVFKWDLLCDKFNLDNKNEFNIAFLAVSDNNKCRVRQLDSLVVKVQVLKPINSAPKLSIVNMSTDAVYDNGNVTVSPGQELNLQMNVSDVDTSPADNLSIELIDNGGDTPAEGWAWKDASGPSVLTTPFTWAPLCSIFTGDVYEHNFYFDFRYFDDRCLTAVVDTIRINVKVKDKESGGLDEDPANVFTPNGDGFNDFYSMERRNEAGDLVNILPVDNCQGVFETVRIYNRWGKQVFGSTDRNFRWYGGNESAGVYYYHVVFTNKQFKGTVSLRD